MILINQIKSLSISFIYGMFFMFTFMINKNILLNNKKILRVILNLLFIIDHVLIFFILIRFINNSKLHIYMLFMFIIGIFFYRYYFTFPSKNKLTKKKE